MMDFDYIIRTFNYLIEGSITSLKIFVVTLFLSIPIGIIFAYVKISARKIICNFIDIYTWLFRGTPLLLQLYFGMYGLPVFGITLDRIMVAYLIFTLNYGAYFTEIFRSGINSVDKGQFEVAYSLGMNKLQTMVKIVLPQSIKKILPTIGNEAITLVKDTSLVAAIALSDILRNAKEVVSRDFRIEGFIIAGVIYLFLTYIVVLIFKKIEKKYSYYS